VRDLDVDASQAEDETADRVQEPVSGPATLGALGSGKQRSKQRRPRNRRHGRKR
jgi:hypothetical protein